MGISRIILRGMGLLLMTGVVYSCQVAEEDGDLGPTPISVQKGEEIISIFEELDLIVLSLLKEEGSNSRLVAPLMEQYGAGLKVKWISSEGAIVLDFGSESESARGVKFSGEMKMYYPEKFWAKGSNTRLEFTNFSIDGVRLSGIRNIKNSGFDSGSKLVRFEASMENGQVIWPGETAMKVTYFHQRDIDVGSVNMNLRFRLTGRTVIRDPFGRKLIAEVVTPMEFRESCMQWGKAHASGGKLSVQTEKADQFVIDFEGDCE